MGLSVAISGGIILTVFMLILLSLPGFVDKMFSIGDITSQVSQQEQKISKTDISLETLFATSGSPYVNFTLNNDDQEKLWNFEKFNVIVEYESASGDELEELSFSGNCLGALPTVGNWCIESFSMANALTCTGAGFDIEIWGSQSVANDSPMVFLAEIASGLSEDDENGSNLDIDLDGDEYMLWGIDNNCANGPGDILNYNIMIFFKERHDNP